MGENFQGQINHGKRLEERKKNEENTRVIISKELPITAEGHKTSHTFNDNDSFTSSLSSTLAKNVSKDLQAEYETELAYVHLSVLRKHSEVTKTFKEWEKLLTTGNDCLEPTLDDIEKNKKG